MTSPQYVTLGEYIYSTIDENEYLLEIYRAILNNYSLKILNGSENKKISFNLDHALRFADILSKSANHINSEKHKIWAQEIVALLNAIYPNNAKIKAYATSILANIGNYRGLQLISTKYKSTSFLDELYSKFDMNYLAIPYQENKFFFHSQKEIYDNLNNSCFSYSGPTSMGKSLIMRMFIKDKICNSFKGNFAILVPTKALISEISTNIINEDLKDELSNQNYKVVTSGNSLFFKEENTNYIMVMTPERMLYTLISYPDISIDYLFIDEAHKISSFDGRSAFYFKVADMLLQRPRKSHIILASPNIPNPNEYFRILPSAQLQNALHLKTSFTPVSQMKYILDTLKNEFLVFNEHSKEKNPFEKIFSINPNDTTESLIKKIISKDASKSNIVYCSGRNKAVFCAREYAKTISPLQIDELVSLAKQIRDDIHSDYYLADLIERGVAYHVGYLPQHIRSKIEKLYRDRKIKTIFCTSTLIEGVNLPADNLIVISCRLGSKGNMNSVEFKNLLGRVGRIEYNLYGNVFIIRDKNMSEKTIKDLLTKPVSNQNIALLDKLSPFAMNYIVQQLTAGSSQFNQLKEQPDEEYDLMRKTGLILLRDVINDRKSVIRNQFSSLLDNYKIECIKSSFASKINMPQPDDDINVSLDQTSNLIDAINNGLEYPKLVDGRVDYYDLKDFLWKMSDIFKWKLYEKTTLGNGNKIDYYAVILSRWMNGYGLNLLLKDTLYYNASHNGTVTINRSPVQYNGSQEHKNLVIGDTLQIIENVILFSIANYFLRFSTEYKKLKTGGQPFDNDWYEYVEYGSTNELTIFFQRNGFSRDTADYIRQHKEKYVVHTNEGIKIKKSLLECEKESVKLEVQDIQYNVPELFID